MPTELPNERQLKAPGSLELDPTGEGVATDETLRLIASSKVEGTAVYDPAGEQLGTISNFMVDKVTGQVAYVVMSFGGFLGLGENHHPLPWRALRYDVDLGGYVIDIDPKTLAGVPRQGSDEAPLADEAFGKAVEPRAPTA